MKYRVKITRLPQARTGYQVQGGLANDIATIGGGDFNSYNGKKQLQDWLGIHYEENIYYGDNHCPAQILRNCVEPEVGKHVLDCAAGTMIKEEQLGLFA